MSGARRASDEYIKDGRPRGGHLLRYPRSRATKSFEDAITTKAPVSKLFTHDRGVCSTAFTKRGGRHHGHQGGGY